MISKLSSAVLLFFLLPLFLYHFLDSVLIAGRIMLQLLLHLFETKKEYLVGATVALAYITYYLLEAVKRPELVGGDEAFAEALRGVPLLSARYWPTPWCVEARLQTVLGSLLRSLLLPPLATSREVLRLADGGQVALDWVQDGLAEGVAVLLVLPGLTGGAQADYVRALAAAAAALGARCVVLNQRGLGGLPLTSPRLYSALSHGDLAEVVAALRARSSAPLLAAGVSLGGLILARYLSAAGAAAGLAGALAVSAPLDVERAASSAEAAPLNALLNWHMARNLRRTVLAHAALRPHWRAVRGARSLRQFDAAFTAGHFGFSSAEEYYAEASLRGRLRGVVAPLLCLCAADDPFQPRAALPRGEAAGAARVALAVTARGGHIGFLEGLWPARNARDQYIARLAHQYFAALLARPQLLHEPPRA